MKSPEEIQFEVEELIKTSFNVQNAELLKTGELGFFTNFLTNIKFDAQLYYQTLFNENNPALAENHSSLFFHSDYANFDFEYSTAATLDTVLVLPKTGVEINHTHEFIIPAGKVVEDINGLYWTFEYTVQIKMSNVSGNKIVAWQLEDNNVKQLSITEGTNPNDNLEIYIIDIPKNLKQYKADTTYEIVGNYEIGENYELNTQIPYISDLNAIDVYRMKKDNLDKKDDGSYRSELEKIEYINTLIVMSDFNLRNEPNLIKLNRQFNRYNMSPKSNDYLLQLNNTQASIILGNGIYGEKVDENDLILIRIKETAGARGNVNSNEFSIDNITLNYYVNDTLVESGTANLRGLSLRGSIGGSTLDNTEDFRRRLVNHIYSRENIVTEVDFKNFFNNLHKSSPAIYSSQVLTGNYIWVYNALFDDDNKVIDTTTINKKTNEIYDNPFMPIYNIDNYDYISPFYYKYNQSLNTWDSYMINPWQQVILSYDVTNSSDVISQMVNLFVGYNYVTQKAYVKLEHIQDTELTYIFNSDQISGIELNSSNSFYSELPNIPTLLHNTYCFIEKSYPLTGIKLRNNVEDIHPSQTEVILYSDDSIYQDTYIQTHPTTKIYNDEYVLKLPIISSLDWVKYNDLWWFNTISNFFKQRLLDDTCVFNVQMIEAFSNTLDIDDKYMDVVFSQKDSETKSSKINLNIYMDIDKYRFTDSHFKSTDNWVLNLKLEVMRWFESNVEGHHKPFREDELEAFIKEKYEFVTNVRIPNQLLYKLNDERAVQNELLDAITENKLTQLDIIDYTPYYFHLDNINVFWEDN